ncbi:MAG: type II toxin-antitoxin system RelE/ParE family toxin [Fusobacteriaceae bacterium]|jgi:mRNA-degrading endonuclease RelE of RelBE toxin-antitoxin system|nr:type II toxin-antitoxin system RelE/ParE family toxin [Fusobacteriaceae bacterium]
MTEVVFSPSSARYFKKLKDKQLKNKFKGAIELISKDYTIGNLKTGDLTGINRYDVYYNKTNYELAYKVEFHEDKIIIVLLAGTRENFYDELKKYIKNI